MPELLHLREVKSSIDSVQVSMNIDGPEVFLTQEPNRFLSSSLLESTFHDPLGRVSCEFQVKIFGIIRRALRNGSANRLLAFGEDSQVFDDWMGFLFSNAERYFPMIINADRSHQVEIYDVWRKCKITTLMLLHEIFANNNNKLRDRLARSHYHRSMMKLSMKLIDEFEKVQCTSFNEICLALDCISELCDNFNLHDKMQIVTKILIPFDCIFGKPIETTAFWPQVDLDEFRQSPFSLDAKSVSLKLLVRLTLNDRRISDAIVQYASHILRSEDDCKPGLRVTALNLLASLTSVETGSERESLESTVQKGILRMLDNPKDLETRRCICDILCNDNFRGLTLKLESKHIGKLMRIARKDPALIVRVKALVILAQIRDSYTALGRHRNKLAKRTNSAKKPAAQLLNQMLNNLIPQMVLGVSDQSTGHLLTNIKMIFSYYPVISYQILESNIDRLMIAFMKLMQYQTHASRFEGQKYETKTIMIDILGCLVTQANLNSAKHNLCKIELQIHFLVRQALEGANQYDYDLAKSALNLLGKLFETVVSSESLSFLDDFIELVNEKRSQFLSQISQITYNFICNQSCPLVDQPKSLSSLFTLCFRVINSNPEGPFGEARPLFAKLIEVTILQYRGSSEFRRNHFKRFISLSINLMDLYCASSKISDRFEASFRSQLLLIIAAAIDIDYSATIEQFHEAEKRRKKAPWELFELFFSQLIDANSIPSEDQFWPGHVSRQIIRTLCAIIRQPKENRAKVSRRDVNRMFQRIIIALKSLLFPDRELTFVQYEDSFNAASAELFKTTSDKTTKGSHEADLIISSLSEQNWLDAEHISALVRYVNQLKLEGLNAVKQYRKQSRNQRQSVSSYPSAGFVSSLTRKFLPDRIHILSQ